MLSRSLEAVDAELGLEVAIADRLAEVQHALVLANLFNLPLQGRQLKNAHFQIVQEVGHGIVKIVKVVDVLLENLVGRDLSLVG